ncbi:nmrA-like family protein [Aspergillus pseudotamarii]|uniref:NmrA-like family protein n=1 Tax=Aspergillus pseudotamarii TaxID=132259 RepID=A0A5N6T691_ASPPS|nr:nmrA-like family protein [Aspergillus pseudotamarii]KAE8141843.1 nmrA-like family protein [Aspergillus pseudotamarii]
MAITVGVAGITGKFARLVVKSLLASPEATIRGFCRNPAKLPEVVRSSARVTIQQGDSYDLDALRSFAHGCDVVICCYLGDNHFMVEGQRLLVDACEHENVPRYIASDYCLDFTKLEFGQHPAKDPMKHIKAYVETKNNIKGVHVLIGVFMETFWSRYFGVWDADEFKLFYYGNGDEVWESTTYGTAAEYVAAVALDASAVGLQHFLGDRKSIRQIADELAEVYGKKPQLERLGSLQDLYTHMQAKFKEDPSNIFAYLASFYQYYCTNGQTYLKKELDNVKYPQVKPATFQSFMQSHTPQGLSDSYQNAGSCV